MTRRTLRRCGTLAFNEETTTMRTLLLVPATGCHAMFRMARRIVAGE